MARISRNHPIKLWGIAVCIAGMIVSHCMTAAYVVLALNGATIPADSGTSEVCRNSCAPYGRDCSHDKHQQ